MTTFVRCDHVQKLIVISSGLLTDEVLTLAHMLSLKKKHMHALINEHLDTMKCLSAQDPALLKVVRQKAVDKFPDLEDYSNCWPVNDIIMMRLKYTSSQQRQQETEMAASKKKKAKTPSQLMGHMGQAWVHMMNGSVHEAQYMTHL
ncbi:hypothetical protein EDD16DRAFT_1527114 [Pisolithus croceorrhizus]|nr:hypothetical protein EDD16DRAFT_1527114 [Pisolithus croceorrhizus]